jgi:pimeloyl-ACP methyl ester carboxylesterase
MKRLHAIVPLAALLAGIIGAPVDAKTVSYPLENACPVVANRPDHDPSTREQIAHTPQGDIAYYLAKHHEVIVFDNRGVGRSLPTASSFTAQDMASDLSALIDTLKLRDVTVLGWSMGGAVATQLAIDHPANVQRIVLMSAPAPGHLGAPVAPDVEATLSGKPGTTFNDVMKVLFPPSAANAAGECFRKNMFVPAGYASPTISATVTAGQTALLRAWEQDDASAGALRTLHTDTLILTGDDDTILSKQNAEALAGTLPDAQLLVVRSAGHAMMYQYPHALATAINRFVTQSHAHPRQTANAAQLHQQA